MNVERDPDAILAAWLEEGPTALPDPTRRAIAVTTRTTTQRRRPIWVPRGRPLMNTYARWAVAAIAIVLAIGGAAYFLAPPGGQVGGTPTASPSPSASTSVIDSATPFQLAKEGFIYPGTWAPAFDPPLTFKIVREVEHNCQPGFACRGDIDVNLPGWLGLEFGQPRIEINVIRVDKVNDPVHAGQVIDPPTDLAAWIASRTDLTVVSQKPVTVGGLAATQLDVQVHGKDITFGPIPGVTDVTAGIGANWIARLHVVTVGGHQVLVITHAEDGSIYELQPIVDSIVWR